MKSEFNSTEGIISPNGEKDIATPHEEEELFIDAPHKLITSNSTTLKP